MLGQLNATLEEENKALVEQVNKLVEQVNMNTEIDNYIQWNPDFSNHNFFEP